ncbi:hypothetical protein TIFTF001_026873 [Ficus carica]|uniref:Uncharacterized protein n=1 Tax=Ficus carica TaxID=3494 RepID=A0AA88IU70_FICCA|nr:hypothetical protein TIFTF001_026873 [Ficus carica]
MVLASTGQVGSDMIAGFDLEIGAFTSFGEGADEWEHETQRMWPLLEWLRGLLIQPRRHTSGVDQFPRYAVCLWGTSRGWRRPVRQVPCSGLIKGSNDLVTHYPNFLYGGAIRLTSLSCSSLLSEGLSL